MCLFYDEVWTRIADLSETKYRAEELAYLDGVFEPVDYSLPALVENYDNE